CTGLREIRDGQPEKGPVRAFVFSTDEGEVVNGAFLDAQGVRPVGGTRSASGASLDALLP
ncbi:MAG: hypothetical protein ACHQU1_09965, partial [Gemmatimonadales bacterium]